MAIIIAFVIATQISVASQVMRLNATQKSVLENSVPLLERSQEFAQLMTATLSQTAKVENSLPIEQLEELWPRYGEQKAQAEELLALIDTFLSEDTNTASFRASQTQLSETIDRMFENQFLQRKLENTSQKQVRDVLRLTSTLEDVIDQMLTKSATTVLSVADQLDSSLALEKDVLAQFLNFAGQIETLYTLNYNITDISNLTQGVSSIAQDTAFMTFSNKLEFRIRSLTQVLAQMSKNDERKKLAELVSKLNHLISSDNGYLAVLSRLNNARDEFTQLKRQQVGFVANVDREVVEIVNSAAFTFRSDIRFANRLGQFILWIGLVTVILVTFGLIWVNKKLIKEQISNRFVILTQDVLAISHGNYDHAVRVTGEDELADIAKALDVFKKQAGELERSNAELERFAYVAAHDLKSPLDAIQDLAKWTLEDADDGMSDDCRHNLGLLIKRSARLSSLQTDLLTYAQASSIDVGVFILQVESEVAAIADMLDPEDNFKIRLLNDLGAIRCHAIPVRQILNNLITNAIKHHDREGGEIIIAITRQDGMLKFTVQDDGPGIESRFQSKIFDLFKTLKPKDQVEGSGLGLALVLKLVERFGGSVSVHSDPTAKRGTTFAFEMPDKSVLSQASTAA